MSRITIKSQNLAYFQALQAQMECSNATEAINHLLMDLKRRGYSFLDGMEYIPQPLEITQPAPKSRVRKPSPVKAIAPTQPIEYVLDYGDIDPVIERFIAMGLVEDF